MDRYVGEMEVPTQSCFYLQHYSKGSFLIILPFFISLEISFKSVGLKDVKYSSCLSSVVLTTEK